MVNLNIVGYDKEKGECELYHMDYLAAAVKVNYAAHGYGGFFTTAILDAHYRKGETEQSFWSHDLKRVENSAYCCWPLIDSLIISLLL